jgi:hypothetical protein
MDAMQTLVDLTKALEAGNYNAAPSTLNQGSALQREDLSDVMHNVTFGDEHIRLQKMLKVKSIKATLAQFDRQLSYGIFGGSAQIEGAVGQEEVSDFVRVVVPMSFYSHIRRVTLAANLVETVDGVKNEERAASDATKKLAGDVEFDLFRGKADFSNAGVFDGNPGAVATLPNISGLDLQVRQSDAQRTARDLMFAEYGSDDTVVLQVGSVLQQTTVEDASVRSAMNHGNADEFVLDPKTLSAFNKITIGKERIVLANAPQEAVGADLRRQWVSGGQVTFKASRFLSAKTGPARSRLNGPSAPAVPTCTPASGTTAFRNGEVYKYYGTAVNELGESVGSTALTVTQTADGQYNPVVFGTVSAAARYVNVYRTAAGGSVYKFIGRLATNGATSGTFYDYGNKVPGFVTGFLIQGDTMDIAELSPYSRTKLAVTDLSQPEAHFRFLTLRVYEPRKNVLLDNLLATF